MPSFTAVVMQKAAPMTRTKMIAFSLSPNHNRARGNQQMLGKACRACDMEPIVSESMSDRAMARPSGMPSATAMP